LSKLYVQKMFATEAPSGGNKSTVPADEVEVTMAVSQSSFRCEWTTGAAPDGQPVLALGVYPLRQ
jgi:hypothetical protein